MKNAVREHSPICIDICCHCTEGIKTPVEFAYLPGSSGNWMKAARLDSGRVPQARYRTQCAKYGNPWAQGRGGLLREREPELMLSVVGHSPQTLTVPWSLSGCLSSSLARGPWQKIWSDLTCDWYQASAKNVLSRKGHSSLLPLDLNIWGPSVPAGIKWTDKLLTYQSKPDWWECRVARGPNELALNMQILWELTRSQSPASLEWPVNCEASIRLRSQENNKALKAFRRSS